MRAIVQRRLGASGVLRIEQVLQAATAHAAIEARSTLGKTLLIVREG